MNECYSEALSWILIAQITRHKEIIQMQKNQNNNNNDKNSYFSRWNLIYSKEKVVKTRSDFVFMANTSREALDKVPFLFIF